MEASLKRLDTQCVALLHCKEQEDEILRSKPITNLKNSNEPLTVSDIIEVLQFVTRRDKLLQHAFSIHLFDSLLELCITTPILEQEYEFYELFTPFWVVLEGMIRQKEHIKNLAESTIKTATQFRCVVSNWLLQTNDANKAEKLVIQKKLLRISSRLCINPQFAQQLVETAGLEDVLETMKRYFDDPDTITLDLQVLIEVAQHKPLRERQVNLGVLSHIANLYKVYTENINVLHQSAVLTGLLVLEPTSQKNRIEIMSIMSCQLQGLKKFRLVDGIIEKYLFSLAAIIHQNQSYQQMFFKSGNLDLLPELLRDYMESPLICSSLSLIINSLTYRNIQMKEILGKRGFVQILVSILAHFTQYENYSFQTVKHALKALGNISVNETNGQVLLSMEFIRISHDLILNRFIVEDPSELGFYCQLTLDIIYTICQPAICPYFLLEQTFKEGLINFILQCIKLNRKNLSILQKAVETLGPFLSYDCAVDLFCQSEGFGIICGLIQIVHFDLNIVLSCFQVLVQVLNYDQEKVDLVMGYQINQDIVKTLRQITIQKEFYQTTTNSYLKRYSVWP